MLERAGDEFKLDGETVTCGAIVHQRINGIEKAVLEARERCKQRYAPDAKGESNRAGGVRMKSGAKRGE